MGSASSNCCSQASDKYDTSGDAAASVISDERIGVGTQGLSRVEINLVRKTWQQAAKLGAANLGLIIFKHVFTIAPEALKLFAFKDEPNIRTYQTPRLKAHGLKFVNTVSAAVDGLHDLDGLKPTLQTLGLRHVGYGVKPPHFDVAGQALMKSLAEGIPAQFTPEVHQAWTKVWAIISSTMISVGDEHPIVMDPASTGPLTDGEVALVQSSWAKAASLGTEKVGVLLFRHIFEIAPEAMQLFPFRDEANVYESPRLKSHASGVVGAVDQAVQGLRRLDEVAPVLQSLGKRHVSYGVLPAHYDVVGQALLKTLRKGLAKAFTPEVEAAWVKVWGIVSTTMQGNNYS